MASTSKYPSRRVGVTRKRPIIEIISESEDEAEVSANHNHEISLTGRQAMEDLYRRIHKDTLGSSPPRKQNRSLQSEASLKEKRNLDVDLKTVVDVDEVNALLENRSRSRSSSCDSNETLILPRREPPRQNQEITQKRNTTRELEQTPEKRRKITKQIVRPPARNESPNDASSAQKQLTPKLKRTVLKQNRLSPKPITSPIKAAQTYIQTSPQLKKMLRKKVPLLEDPRISSNATCPANKRPKFQTSLPETSPNVQVSHEPFEFDIRLNPKSKTLKPSLPPKNSSKTKLKRLSTGPLAANKRQVAAKVPAKKQKIKPNVESIKTESPPAIAQKSGVQDVEPIDVDTAAVSSLMMDGLWDTFEVISKKTSTNYTLVKSIIDMIEKGFTLPFICRYRRDQSGGLSPEVIQSIKDEYSTLVEVRKKAKALVSKLETEGNLNNDLKESILSSRTIEELNIVMEPLKQSGPRTHAAKARSIGLETIANPIWKGEKILADFDIRKFIDSSVPGKSNINELLKSIRYILADEVRKSRKILDRMEEISRTEAELHVKQRKAKSQKTPTAKESNENFRDYYDFTRKVSVIESYQILAINRGEHLGCLSVSVNLMPFFESSFKECLKQQFHSCCFTDPATKYLIEQTVEDCYERLCKPYITRVSRANLKERADKEALKVFSANLRALLMTPPIRGKSVLGIDPGFVKGCKLAVISKSGELLDSSIMYLNNRPEQVLTSLVKKYGCYLFAVGDGKGGQEVKSLITSCNQRKLFGDQPVRFTTVREAGVSIYSVSPAAEEELPGLDCFVKGAVAIARRLQDPLVEFIKVEPKNLGIGMYQHDINESRLKEALQSTVVECVSFVGVDINVCPEFLLRQVAGLNATAAKNIIAYRQKNGPFRNREQLRKVPHIGPKRYEQCAGFVKILPETLKQCLDESLVATKTQKPNEKAISERLEALDTTIIHPESYDLTRRIIFDLGLDVKDIGTQEFIDVVSKKARADDFAQKFEASLLTVELILKALKAKRNWDVRDEGSAPIFCAGSISMANITLGQKVSGRVINVVPFGAFVDIAMDKDALIYQTYLGAARGIIKLGDVVECRVIKKDLTRQRISLAFESFK